MYQLKCTWCGDLLAVTDDKSVKSADFFCDENCYNHYNEPEEDDEEDEE